MNYTRGEFKGRKKRFNTSLKKNQAANRQGESTKENDRNSGNRDLEMYNCDNAGLCDEDNLPTDSQNYVLRLSDNTSELDGRKLSYFYDIKESKRSQTERNTTVSICDSNNSSSGENLPRFKTKSSRIRPTPFYSHHSASVIVIESSDSDEDRVLKSGDKDGGIIGLDSDDDSVLNMLKIDRKDPFDLLKRSTDLTGAIDNLSFNSGQSSQRCKSGNGKESEEFSKKTEIASGFGPRYSSGASSSTNFSTDSNVVKDAGSLRGRKIISESSSNDEEILSNVGKTSAKSYGERNKFNTTERSKKKTLSSNDCSSSKANNFGNVTIRSTSKYPALAKTYEPVKLTKTDAERIFKGTKVADSHWTPVLGSPYFKNMTASLASSPRDSKSGKIINETASELAMSKSSSGDEIISNSSPDLKPGKTHVGKFVNPPNQEQQYTSLSVRKKEDISHWLMNNTRGSTSSSSIISDSNRNSSFGNSSLERFELKHETPNNRGKISKPGMSEKANTGQRSIDDFIYKGKTSVLKNQTPLGVRGISAKREVNWNEATPETPIQDTRKAEPKKDLPIIKSVENLRIEDCADILDKLYGNIWRTKAVLTPQTEPGNKKKLTNKEPKSKTERKNTSKFDRGKALIISSSEDDDFNALGKEVRPNPSWRKKKVVRESFIDDKSPSENSSESFYHTALTNPRESKDNQRLLKPVPVSNSTKRVAAICDPDSDLEDNYPPLLRNDLNKRQLSFSEDTSDSSTSEFDPGEVVPPKPKAKKAPTKTIRQIPKPNDAHGSSEHNILDKRSKSFLASLSATVPIPNCHPEARIYRDNYKNKKEELCRYLFQLYNKQIFDGKLPNDMALEWNVRMRGTAGFCYNKKSVRGLGGVVRSSRIVLATKILDTPDRLRDTLIHEMCHAAAWLINNVSDGHGPFWKGWASKAVKVFPELPPIKRCHDYKIKTKFTYKCTQCGYSIGRHSKSLNVETKRCGYCYGKFELLINRTTKSGTAQVATPVQTKTPTGFALFVKENYHSVRKDQRSIKHVEVMKILGQQFSAVKIGKKPASNDART